MKHTPGPWKYDFSSRNIDSNYGIVATVRKGNAGKTCWDNAALIAAAPDLLSASKCALADLQGIMPIFEPSRERAHPAWRTIKELTNAIAKAEGRRKP